MANKILFSSIKSKFVRTDTYNEAGGRAYKFTPKHALAQMAATGCFNGVFYASAQSQLDEMRKPIDQVDDNVFELLVKRWPDRCEIGDEIPERFCAQRGIGGVRALPPDANGAIGFAGSNPQSVG